MRELDELSEWCVLLTRAQFDFAVANHSGADDQFFREMLELKLDAIERTKARLDLRGLRMIYRDVNEMARGLAATHRGELDRRLRERFGRGLESGQRDLELRAGKILKRGKINNAEEYRTLEGWFDAILHDPSMQNEAGRINALLATVKEPLPE
jgi:hypothetical protein